MAMALEMDGIIEYGVIDLMMWVVALSLNEGEVFVTCIAIFKKKSVVFASKLYMKYFLRVL